MMSGVGWGRGGMPIKQEVSAAGFLGEGGGPSPSPSSDSPLLPTSPEETRLGLAEKSE